MGKKVIAYMSLIAIVILSGCVTISPTNKIASALGGSIAPISSTQTDINAKKCSSFNHIPFSYSNSILANSVIRDLTNNLPIFHENNNNVLNLDKSEFIHWFWEPAGFLLGTGGLLATIDLLSHDLLSDKNKTNIKDQPEFERVLRFYLKQYIEGKFVLRDGTKLAKPNGSISNETVKTDKGDKSILSTSLDNSTVTGLTTVVLEALYDYCLETTTYAYSKDGENATIIYKPVYEVTKVGDSKYNLFYKQDKNDNYLFGDENHNIPTVVEFGNQLKQPDKNKYLTYLEECKKEKESACRMTEADVLAIRRISNFSATTTKAAVGATFKSLGGLGLSAFGFIKFSLGDNDSINKIVETLISVAARREAEHILDKLVNSGELYRCGSSDCSEKVTRLLEKF